MELNIKNEALKIAKLAGKAIISREDFPAGDDFDAYNKAVDYARSMNLNAGSMQREAPVALANADQFGYVAKWRNISQDEYPGLSGVILGEDKRNGNISVILFG